MDKDTLRITIFLIGLLVVVGMIAWSFFQHQKDQREFEKYEQSSSSEHQSLKKEHTLDVISSVLKKTSEIFKESPKTKPAPSKASLPISDDLIQLSIVSTTEQGFKGQDIFKALKEARLEYGNLYVFERIDVNRMVHFTVASMVSPGTFPEKDLEKFSSPGLSFYMLPKQVQHSIEVFEDFVRTLNFVALKLEGTMMNHQQKLLTDEYLDQIRQRL